MVTPKQALISSSVALALASVAPAGASEIDVLKEQIQALSQEIQLLKSDNTVSYSRRAGAAKHAKGVMTGAKPNSININGTDVQFGGFLRGDFAWDDSYQTAGGDASPNALPSGASVAAGTAQADETRFRAFAKHSRFFIDLKKKAGNGTPIRGHLEFDFNTTTGNQNVSNSHHARLRHAYFDYGKLKVGQFWSNVMQFHAKVPQLNANTTSGDTLIRQAGARLTLGSFAVSLENIENNGLAGGGNGGSIESFPDVTARWEGKFGPVKIGVSGVIGQMKVATDSDVGYMAHLGISWGLGKGSKVVFNAKTSEGRTRYIAQAPGGAGSVAGGVIIPTETDAFTLGWMQKLGAGTLTLFYGLVDSGNTITDENSRAYVNYIWSPAKGISFGVELGRDERKDVGFSAVNNTRIQFAGIYNFAK